MQHNYAPLCTVVHHTQIKAAHGRAPFCMPMQATKETHFTYKAKDQCKSVEEQQGSIWGINLIVCTHRIYTEDDYKPRALPQRYLNPNVKEVVKGEVLRLYENSRGILD
ncbi:hypothetical protein CR513_52178, partial [Mucuna pruriens]